MATVVFFHAHPDDEAIATGGTMALLADEGHRVVLVVATRGEMGEPNEGILDPGEALGDRREAEVRHAGQLLGVESVEFLGYRDSGMVEEASNDDPRCFWQADLEEASQRLCDILKRVEADVLVGYDPNGTYGHPDHIKVHLVGERAGALAGLDRVFWTTANRDMIQAAMDSGAFDDDDEEPDERVDRSQMGMPEAELTHAINVISVIDRKKAALAAHASQIDEQSFFLSMPDDVFEMAFGTEWFVNVARHRANAERVGELAGSLFDG